MQDVEASVIALEGFDEALRDAVAFGTADRCEEQGQAESARDVGSVLGDVGTSVVGQPVDWMWRACAFEPALDGGDHEIAYHLAGDTGVRHGRPGDDLAVAGIEHEQDPDDRHQLNVLRRTSPRRPVFSNFDRMVFICLYRIAPRILDTLTIVEPETVIHWHRAGFRSFWRWKSRRRAGRPSVPPEIRRLIREMSLANPLWGAPRIHGELLKLGIDIGQTSVAKYMARRRRPPSQGWRTFLLNHAEGIASIDLFIVPTISFRLLYGLLVLEHSRRRIMWLGVTAHPTAEWIARQVSEACGWEPVPTYLIRDRDRVYGEAFTRRVRAMGIRDRPTAPRSPWQNGYAERLIGSIRRECLDHVIVFGERHLRHALGAYQQYYNGTRTHLALAKDSPLTRSVQAIGGILSLQVLGGLHHHYVRI